MASDGHGPRAAGYRGSRSAGCDSMGGSRPLAAARDWPSPAATAAQASAAGPRLTIWSAMMARWISLVPSQMRSTRNSRKNRSATFSRV